MRSQIPKKKKAKNLKKRTRTKSQRVQRKQKIRRVERHLSHSKAAIPTFTLMSVPATWTTTTTTTTASTPAAMPYPPALVVTVAPATYCAVFRKQPCPFSTKAYQSSSPSEWSEEDWDRDRQRE